jgi:threonine/homoserine/homoserine lactone efflux protein
MTIETWLLFCVTETVLCFTPGPAVLTVVSLALTAGARAGLGASAGVLAANAFYFLLSATGIGAVLLASYELFFLIKWVGAAYLYLVWFGARMLWARARVFEPAPAGGRRARGAQRSFVHGLVTQGANPKALVFFTALLPQFIHPQSPVAVQVAILAVSSILIELVVLALYVTACQRARGLMHRPAFATSLQRAGGVLLIGAGAGLATLRRS